jgi:hypothetical protein
VAKHHGLAWLAPHVLVSFLFFVFFCFSNGGFATPAACLAAAEAISTKHTARKARQYKCHDAHECSPSLPLSANPYVIINHILFKWAE